MSLPVASNIITTGNALRQHLISRFRCSEEFIGNFSIPRKLPRAAGFFRVGDIICYGQCSSATLAKSVTELLHDVSQHEMVNGNSIHLPFDPAQVVDNLCNERYIAKNAGVLRSVSGGGTIRSLYYRMRPLMPVRIRKHFQRLYLRGWQRIPFPQWPVDRTIERLNEHLLVLSMQSQNLVRIPFIWFWPEGYGSSAVMTHDVETLAGRDFCSRLMDINDSFCIKSSFQVVPEERYPVPESYLESIRSRGFEVNVQDLNHDGHLFRDHAEFLRRAERINAYRRQWGAQGFRSAVLYRNTDWYDGLEFPYDMSIPNVAHLDPQRGGCCTVFPFMIGKTVELPVTTIQDYSLFHILKDYSTSLWEQQISLIREQHGFINVIIHPDYIIDHASQGVYKALLRYLCDLRSTGDVWFALPRDVAEWWRLRSEMTLVRSGDTWRIEGNGSDRARVAYATFIDGKLEYEMPPSLQRSGS